jgi:hypothetical protein
MQNNYNVKTRQAKTFQPKYIGDKKVDEVTGDTYGIINKIYAMFLGFKERVEALLKEMLTRIIQHTHDGTDSTAITIIIGVLEPHHGGTGIANNDLSTLTIAGAFPLTVTLSAATNVTLPTSGTLIANPMSAVGDLIHGGAAGLPARLPIGAVDTVLKSNGTDTAWDALMGLAALDVPVPANGRLIYYNPVSGVCEWLNTSAELLSVINDETGSGVLVFGTNPTISIPIVDLIHFTPQASHPAAVAGINREYYLVGDRNYKYVCLSNGDVRRIPLTYLASDSWREDESYVPGDIVNFRGLSYTCLTATSSVVPGTNTDYWILSTVYATLVSHWKGENNADDTLNVNDGVWVTTGAGAEGYVAGAIGNEFSFAASSPTNRNYVSVTHSTSLNFAPTDSFTIVMYFKVTDVGIKTNFLLNKPDSYGLWVYNKYLYCMRGGTSIQSDQLNMVGATRYKLHVSYVNGLWNAWLDGTLVYTSPVGQTIVQDTHNLLIGGGGNWQQDTVGSIDELKIFNAAYTPSQL